MNGNFFNAMQRIAVNDINTLIEKGRSYGDSWKRRGGIGCFMMLARKWDRLEIAAEKDGYDIFRTVTKDTRAEGILDDIADLRRYLFLLETEMRLRLEKIPNQIIPPSPLNPVAASQPVPIIEQVRRELAKTPPFAERVMMKPKEMIGNPDYGAAVGATAGKSTDHPAPYGFVAEEDVKK